MAAKSKKSKKPSYLVLPVDTKLKAKVRAAAKRKDQSMSAWMRTVLTRAA